MCKKYLVTQVPTIEGNNVSVINNKLTNVVWQAILWSYLYINLTDVAERL